MKKHFGPPSNPRAAVSSQLPPSITDEQCFRSEMLGYAKTHGMFLEEIERQTRSARAATTPGPFANFGEQLIAIRAAAISPHSVDARLEELNRRAAPSGASETVPADGGFLIQSEFSVRILQKAYLTGQFLSRANYVPITKPGANSLVVPGIDEKSRVDGSRWGGVSAYWQNEATAATATKPKFRLNQLVLKKLIGLCYWTDELLEDSGAFGNIMTQAFASEFAYRMESGAVFGDGSGKPLGVMNSNALVTVAKESSQASGSLVAQNIVKMWARCWGPSRSRAIWFVNQEIEPQLLTMTLPVGSGGSECHLYRPAEDDDQPFGRLLGRPVIPLEYLPTIGTPGDILFVDPLEYLYTDQGGINSAMSIHVSFATDQDAFKFVWRCDGAPIWNSAVTPANGTNALSPYVALAQR